jgi:hypothetical protein
VNKWLNEADLGLEDGPPIIGIIKPNAKKLKVCDLSIFPIHMEEHSRPFAMGNVLAMEGEELDLQWYGNYHELCTGTYRPCWLQQNEDKYYYKPNKTNKKPHALHVD